MPPSDRMSATTFTSLQETLTRARAACDAAESHGTLCGVLCVGVDGADTWLEHILGEDAAAGLPADRCRKELTALKDATRNALTEGALGFTPLLPDDETTLNERTEALGEWCQGFLYGVGLGGQGMDLDALPDEAGEVLRDMSQIAQAGFEGEGASDEDEAAYTEIVEYLRVGVQLLFEELRSARGAPPSIALH